MKRLSKVLALALLHWIAIVSITHVFPYGGAFYLSPAFKFLLRVLLFPIVEAVMHSGIELPRFGLIGIVIPLNSLLWGLCITCLVERKSKSLKEPIVDSPDTRSPLVKIRPWIIFFYVNAVIAYDFKARNWNSSVFLFMVFWSAVVLCGFSRRGLLRR